MTKIGSVEELEVFKRAHQLTLTLYREAEKLPVDERFGLVAQIRRSAASICANLIEGSHRLSRKEFRQFVGIAKGSIGELKYHLLLARDLGYIRDQQYGALRLEAEEISRMLNGLIRSLSDTSH